MVNTGDTAWILTSASLVLLMTPGLALFYGGMVRAKSVLNMMMMGVVPGRDQRGLGARTATRWRSATTSASA